MNPGGPWPRIAALAVMAGITLLASGCGGSPSSGPGATSTTGTPAATKAVAYSNCMRAHGVDVSVGSNGNLSSGGGSGGASSQTVQAAQNACRHLLPNGGQPSQAQQQANLKQALKYTQCMRSHGMPDFPDPSANPNGPIGFNHVDAGAPAYAKANQACKSVLPGSGS